jgi:hypothetical protein
MHTIAEVLLSFSEKANLGVPMNGNKFYTVSQPTGSDQCMSEVKYKIHILIQS